MKAEATAEKKTTATLKMGVCSGRHSIPAATDGYIFNEIKDVTDTEGLLRRALVALWNAAICKTRNGDDGYLCVSASGGSPRFYADDGRPYSIKPGTRLDLYVTGLTVATVAVINACQRAGIYVVLWHYNSATGDYYPQEVESTAVWPCGSTVS